MKINDITVDIDKVCTVDPIIKFKDMAVISCNWYKLPKALRKSLITDVLGEKLDTGLTIDDEFRNVDIYIPCTHGRFNIDRAFLYVNDYAADAAETREIVNYICNNTYSYICCCLLPLNLSAADKHKIAMLLNDYSRYTILDISKTITEDAEFNEAERKRTNELLKKHKGA